MNADKSYFERLADNVKRQRMDKMGRMQQKSKDVVAASYEIALLVAEQKQPHTIAESLILPGAKILVKRVFGEQAIAKLNAVSLSDNTIKRRIEGMSDDIADQILAEIKESKFGFAIQIDESTDGVVVRASASQSVDFGFIPLVESYQKTLKNGIHSFPAWRSAFRGGCREQAGKFACCVLGQGT